MYRLPSIPLKTERELKFITEIHHLFSSPNILAIIDDSLYAISVSVNLWITEHYPENIGKAGFYIWPDTIEKLVVSLSIILA